MYSRLNIPNNTLTESIDSSLNCKLRNNLGMMDSNEEAPSIYASNTFDKTVFSNVR